MKVAGSRGIVRCVNRQDVIGKYKKETQSSLLI
jgi:hypothetical protein